MIIPHKIVILFKADAHQMMADGHCKGIPIKTTGNIILDIDTNNEEEAKLLVNKLEMEIRQLCLKLSLMKGTESEPQQD